MRRVAFRILFLSLALAASTAAAEWFDPAKGSSTPEGDGDFYFIVMADNQPWPSAYDGSVQNEYFYAILARANTYKHDFVVMAGDLTRGDSNDPAIHEREWDGYHKACATLKTPYVTVPGNHDTWDEASADRWMKRHGPPYFSWNHKGCHFIALSSEITGQRYKIVGEQLEWLKRDIEAAKDARRIFVFLHNPLWTRYPEPGEKDNQWNLDVHPLLAKYGVDTVFAGHFHSYLSFPLKDGVNYVITGPTGGMGTEFASFYHFLLVEVSEARSSYKIVTFDAEHSPGIITRTAEREFVASYREEFVPPGEKGDAAVKIHLKNTLEQPLKVRYELKTGGTSWKRAGKRALLKPGEEADIYVKTRIKGPLFPPPKISLAMDLEGLRVWQDERYVAIPLDISKEPRLMDDFEDGDITNMCAMNGIVQEEGGIWWIRVDSYGVSKAESFAVEEITDGIAGSKRAGHVTGYLAESSPGKPAEATFFMGLSVSWSEIDLTAASGMSFWVKSPTKSNVSFHLLGWDKDENAFRRDISLDDKWRRYAFFWRGSMKDPAAPAYEPIKVMMPLFKIQDEGNDFDIWIDDLTLLFSE